MEVISCYKVLDLQFCDIFRDIFLEDHPMSCSSVVPLILWNALIISQKLFSVLSGFCAAIVPGFNGNDNFGVSQVLNLKMFGRKKNKDERREKKRHKHGMTPAEISKLEEVGLRRGFFNKK